MTDTYRLECTDCSYRTVVVGEFADALSEVETHRAEHDAGSTAHFVNVRRNF